MFALLLTLSMFSMFGTPNPTDALALEVVPPRSSIVEGERLDLVMRLVHHQTRESGKAPPVWVVKPGDGSEVGWREPWVRFEVEQNTPGPDGVVAWVRLGEPQLGRCGLYDPNWEKDAVALAAGESIPLKDWLPDPAQAFGLKAGTYRVTVRYQFRGGATKGHIPASTPPKVMVGVAPYEVVSKPIELVIVKR
jgi:hypothetical protein